MYKKTACYSTSFSVLGMTSKSFGFQLKPGRNENLPEWTDLLLARTGPGSHIAGVKMLPDERYLGRSRSSKVDKYFFNPQSSLNCAIESVGKICQLASHSSKRPIEQTQPFDTIVFTYFSTPACTREMVRSCCFIFNSEKMIENRTRWKYDLSNIISNLIEIKNHSIHPKSISQCTPNYTFVILWIVHQMTSPFLTHATKGTKTFFGRKVTIHSLMIPTKELLGKFFILSLATEEM